MSSLFNVGQYARYHSYPLDGRGHRVAGIIGVHEPPSTSDILSILPTMIEKNLIKTGVFTFSAHNLVRIS